MDRFVAIGEVGAAIMHKGPGELNWRWCDLDRSEARPWAMDVRRQVSVWRKNACEIWSVPLDGWGAQQHITVVVLTVMRQPIFARRFRQHLDPPPDDV
jgi:hypothetical protein